ncbi:TonB-dependent receptor [Bacteroides fragilis]|uniref:SusC/RagA family TonB-linked outer membrane protein n=1 Tax=Bacteroides fragilis TaxID=817 RepID=UPI001F2A782F|nr:TonB-dependent receptor [Bacteroides fragilis]MCE8616938.1 TonB-dependent receptor [Bacteroides fragilis]MCZ2603158.1 TonB-dependent receptor [Bacteroides fragilis]UHZ87673.1 TonB-dependent receptor [Bacteroides fragilis]
MNLKDLNNLRADTEGRIKAVFLICMFVLVSAGGFAQNTKSISGTVRDKGSNETVIGATVQVKGTHNGVITNENGEYTIKNVSPGQVLVFSMIGMNTVEKTVGSQNRIDVLMDSGVLIDEVVVTGYQTQRKVDLTGSVSSLSSDQFMQTNPLSLEQALKGKISGVQVMNNDGAPGGGITIKIRGASSITAGSSPLYVIDGFPLPISDDPLESPLATISPDAIESISILKDVSSTAIYGAQGANGVVLITTKKGTAGMSEISVKATYGISKLANSIPMLGAEDYMRAYMRDMIMSGRWQNADFYQEYKDQVWNTNPSRFQFYPDLCLQNGTKQNYEVSYRGGTERIQNSTIFSLMNEDGIAINTGFKRFYFQTNNSIKLLPQLTLNTNISYEHNIRSGAFWTEGNIFNEIQTFSPLVPKEWTFQEIDDNLYYTGKMDNPYRKLKDIDYNNKNNTFFGQAELVYNINDNWFVKGGIGVRIPKGEVKEFVPKTIQRGYDNNGLATYATQSGLNMRGVIQAGFNKVFNKVHSLSVNAVYEANTNKYETFNQEYSQFNTDLGWEGIYDAKSGNHVKSPGVSYEKIAMLSGVFMANYSYKGRYLLKASMRADGSSKFSPDNRWGFFPSGALGWRVSEEEFFKNVPWLEKNVSNLKLRFSYGQVGNDQIAPYAYAQTLSSSQRQAIFGDGAIPALYTSRMANPEISWEVTEEFNGGLDLDMFNNRLNVSLDLYTKTTRDMLLEQNLPRTSGFGKVTRNIGSVRNRGFEISVGGVLIDKKDFTWNATVNFSSNQSKVLSLGTETQMLEGRPVGSASGSENVLIKKRYPLGLFYGLQMEGIRSNWHSDYNGIGSADSPWWYATEREMPYGFPSFADTNGDGKVDMSDRVVIGDVNPVFIGGLNTRLRWKFIELAMDFSWSYGNDIINGNVYNLMNNGDIRNKSAVYYKDAWFANNPTGTFTGPGAIDWSGYMWAASNSEMVEDGSFLKMNNLAVTFRLPKNVLKAWKIKDLALTYTINNVFCLTNYSGYDPEVRSGSSVNNRILPGVDISAYPYARSHIFSLNFKY